MCAGKPGKYPALLRVPGAGVRGYAGAIVEAEKGMITLEIGIHGIPVTLEPSVYASLSREVFIDINIRIGTIVMKFIINASIWDVYVR